MHFSHFPEQQSPVVRQFLPFPLHPERSPKFLQLIDVIYSLYYRFLKDMEI